MDDTVATSDAPASSTRVVVPVLVDGEIRLYYETDYQFPRNENEDLEYYWRTRRTRLELSRVYHARDCKRARADDDAGLVCGRQGPATPGCRWTAPCACRISTPRRRSGSCRALTPSIPTVSSPGSGSKLSARSAVKTCRPLVLTTPTTKTTPIPTKTTPTPTTKTALTMMLSRRAHRRCQIDRRPGALDS